MCMCVGVCLFGNILVSIQCLFVSFIFGANFWIFFIIVIIDVFVCLFVCHHFKCVVFDTFQTEIKGRKKREFCLCLSVCLRIFPFKSNHFFSGTSSDLVDEIESGVKIDGKKDTLSFRQSVANFI